VTDRQTDRHTDLRLTSVDGEHKTMFTGLMIYLEMFTSYKC